VVFAACCGIALGAVDRLRFVEGWPIELPGDGDFFDIALTPEIYRAARSLDQLAVLDAQNEPMPFYRVDAPTPVISEQSIERGVSAIYRIDSDDGVTELSVAAGGDRTNVTVTRAAGDADAEVVAFVIDAREIEQAPQAIELEWTELDRPFLMSVGIEWSDDLTGWRNVGRGSIASLTIDGAEVRHDRVAVRGAVGGYYRVSWDRRIADWTLERAVLIHNESAESVSFGRIELEPIDVDPAIALADTIYFDLGGRLPVTSAELVFAAANRWVEAGLEVSGRLDGGWQSLASRYLFYDVDYEGESFASDALRLRRTEGRYWRLRLDSQPPAGGVRLALTYPEERLRFAANGVPPYLLAAGTLLDEAGPDRTFASVMTALDQDDGRIANATLAQRGELGGAAALEPPYEFPWRSVVLWAALLAAVATVGWMAVRLARDMKRRD
jgi:hypothetical protein